MDVTQEIQNNNEQVLQNVVSQGKKIDNDNTQQDKLIEFENEVIRLAFIR
jgi:hypothetical protein